MDGPFVGRGPRGYRRPDDRIKEDICEVLTLHGRVDASDIEVHVDQGIVTLQGSVDGRRTKRLVEDIADEVSGVRDVRNELSVTTRDDVPSSQPPSRRWHDEGSPAEGRFMTSSGSEYRQRLREHMEVVGSDGEGIGDVSEISNNSFLVDRPLHRDVFVPFNAIRSMSGNRVTLSVQADEVDEQGWATPALMSSSAREPEQ
jgi:hypothetical protein